MNEVNREALYEDLPPVSAPKIQYRIPTPPPPPPVAIQQMFSSPAFDLQDLAFASKSVLPSIPEQEFQQKDIKMALEQKFDREGRPMLKRTELKRSPGGTPVKNRSPERGSLQYDLFDGLRKRFQLMRHQEDDGNKDDYDEDFKPLATSKKVPPPIPPKTTRVKQFKAIFRK
jgi:hypothetical protein